MNRECEKNIEKFNYEQFVFEITRKCNLKCAHCCRGKAQNITITKKIIDTALEQVAFIKNLFFTGGEPFLKPKIIEYIANKIINSNLLVGEIDITTNGTILNKKCIEVFNRLAEYLQLRYKEKNLEKEHYIQITISNDIYHKNNINEAYNFFRKECSDLIYVKTDNAKTGLYLEGNAFKNREKVEKHATCMYEGICHRVEFTETSIRCPIQISANGNVSIGKTVSYETQDRDCMGNIFDKPIFALIIESQWKNPLTCEELLEYNKAKTYMDMAKNMSDFNKMQYCCKQIMRIKDLREKYHGKHPDATFREVQELINLHTPIKELDKFHKTLNDKTA